MIGIITHYYNSLNYGGILQAYALCKFLIDHKYDSEQICFKRTEKLTVKNALARVYTLLQTIFDFMLHRSVMRKIEVRKHMLSTFRNDSIPHSSKVYSNKTMNELARMYDAFITGSDQVWHPYAVCDAYLLNFKCHAPKIAYAASVSTNHLSDTDKVRYRSAFKEFKAISVREKDAVEIIQPLSPVAVKWVMDPVFLLDKGVWEQFAIEPEEKNAYIFCYFLGSDSDVRRLAMEFSEKMKMDLVTMPYLNCKYRKCDEGFGSKQLFSVTPNEFVGLIKKAEYVLTDSFHAMAFSLIFEKEYFVFERKISSQTMSSRIESLSDLLGFQSRFCNVEQRKQINYLLGEAPLDYRKNDRIKNIIEESKRFLLGSLKRFV